MGKVTTKFSDRWDAAVIKKFTCPRCSGTVEISFPEGSLEKKGWIDPLSIPGMVVPPTALMQANLLIEENLQIIKLIDEERFELLPSGLMNCRDHNPPKPPKGEK